MADNLTNDETYSTTTGTSKTGLQGNTEPATTHDVTEGGVLGAVGGAIVGGLAGGPLGAVIGAVIGGAASAGAVDVVDKHDNDYARTVSTTRTGAMDDDATVNDHLHSTTTGYAPSTVAASTLNTSNYATGLNAGTRDVDGEIVVPIVEEELQVGKRQVQSGGARIHTDVIETPVEQSINLREEHVTVNRVPVDRAATSADTAFTDRTYEVTETGEVPVVAKTARVVEEVVIGKTATDRVETVSDTVRRTDVEVEKLDGDVRPTNR